MRGAGGAAGPAASQGPCRGSGRRRTACRSRGPPRGGRGRATRSGARAAERLHREAERSRLLSHRTRCYTVVQHDRHPGPPGHGQGQVHAALPRARAPARSATRTASRPSSSTPSGRRSSSGRGCTWAGSSGCPARARSSPGSCPGSSRRSWWPRASTARCTRSTTCAPTGATRWCGRSTRRRSRRVVPRSSRCKYHGWRYGLDGRVTHVTNEDEFFDLDKDSLRHADGALRGVRGVRLREPGRRTRCRCARSSASASASSRRTRST